MNVTQPQIFQQTVIVKPEHLDEMDHVNNVQYLQWVQDIAKAHWNEAADPLWLDQYIWVALNHYIEYKKPALLKDELLIQTHVQEFSGPKCHRLVRMTNTATQQLVVQSSTWWCMLDKATSKPVRIMDDMVTAFSES